MARVSYSNVGRTPFRRLLGHNPQLLEAYEVIDEIVVSDKLTLPADLREEVRRHLAYGIGCRY